MVKEVLLGVVLGDGYKLPGLDLDMDVDKDLCNVTEINTTTNCISIGK